MPYIGCARSDSSSSCRKPRADLEAKRVVNRITTMADGAKVNILMQYDSECCIDIAHVFKVGSIFAASAAADQLRRHTVTVTGAV